MAKNAPKKHADKELTEQLQRLQAEFDNYRKRIEREQEQHRQRATEGIIRELIPVMDNFRLALTHKDNQKEIVQGLMLIHDQLHAILEGHGVQEVPATGKFNPALHEAIQTASDGKHEHNDIIETLQPGYTLGEKLLRPARVSVFRKEG